MTIFKQIFSRKRPVFSRLLSFGFNKTEDGFAYTKNFFCNDFTLVFFVSKSGATTAKVIDNMNDEDYSQIDAEGIVGGYVGDVRLAYEKLLLQIADECFEDVLFSSDQANRITQQIFSLYGVAPDFPWKDDKYKPSGVFRHADTGKWFGLIMSVKRSVLDASAGEKDMANVLNLKRDATFDYRAGGFTFKDGQELPLGVYPAYHMNHKLWLSVLLDDTLEDSAVLSLVQASFTATTKK